MRPASKVIVLYLFHVCYSAFVPHINLRWPGPPVTWSDEEDLYFDRIVPLSIAIENYGGSTRPLTNIAISCLIDENRVLTAYNPFRSLIINETMLQYTVATVLQSRKRIPNKMSNFTYNIHNISCGRRVVSVDERYLTHKQWHGIDQIESPVHDLMVLRIDPKIKKFKEETFLGDYTMSKVYGNPKEVVERHDLIFKTELAHPRERLTYPLRIGTLHQKYDELLGQQVLTYTYEKVSAAVLDCGEWLPNYWGNFICIANDYQLKTLTAGSMLVSHYKLFGIGSFAYFRGGEGVLVFTDVRLYSEQIMNACTHTDWEDD